MPSAASSAGSVGLRLFCGHEVDNKSSGESESYKPFCLSDAAETKVLTLRTILSAAVEPCAQISQRRSGESCEG